MANGTSAIVVNDGRLATIDYLKNSVSGATPGTQINKFFLKEFWLLNGVSGGADVTAYWDPPEGSPPPENLYQFRLANDSFWDINNRTTETGYKLRLTLVVPNAYDTGASTIDGVAIIAEDMSGNEFLYAYGIIDSGPNKPAGFDLTLFVDVQF
jgi:hypothetical protein